jgi:broad specificity phosphatase PhoE
VQNEITHPDRRDRMKIILVRHGESGWNKKQITQGQQGEGLTELGFEQARALAKRVTDLGITHVYSSDLSRARETADEIAKVLDLPVSERRDLREISLGEWEGKTYTEVFSIPGVAETWRNAPSSLRPPGGETFQQFQERGVQAIRNIIAAHKPDDVIGIATHGGLICALLAYFSGVPLDAMWQYIQANSAYSILDVDEGGEVTLERVGEKAKSVKIV